MWWCRPGRWWRLRAAQRIAALGVVGGQGPGRADRGGASGPGGVAGPGPAKLGRLDALVTEAGFEHWHRMLFARFLADNGLLVHPQYQVPCHDG